MGDGDAESEDESETAPGVMGAMRSTHDASDLFGLFAALGSAASRNAPTAAVRNPLPRGRMVEKADWIVEALKFLPEAQVPDVRVPLSLVIQHSRPHTWYTTKGGVVCADSAAGTDTELVLSRFLNASNENAALLGAEGQLDIVAAYIYRVWEREGTRPKIRVEYFDVELFRDFLRHRSSKPEGLVQTFTVPTGGKACCVRARYSQGRVSVENRTNVNMASDGRKSLRDRAVTFDGEEHLSRRQGLPVNSALHAAVSKQLCAIVANIDENIGRSHTISEADAYFRVHPDGRLCAPPRAHATTPDPRPPHPRLTE